MKQFLNIRQLVDGIDSGKGDLSRLVHDKSGALADARHGSAFPQDVEFLRNLAVRIEVGTERDLNWPDFPLPPRDMTHDGIYTDVQNLGIAGREFFAARIEFRHLHCSSRGPVQGVESDHEVLLFKIIA